MEIPLDNLIQIIVREVIAELTKAGIKVNGSERFIQNPETKPASCTREEINMRNYQSPVLTENHINCLKQETTEILIPKGTVITPGARDIIRKRNLKLIINN